MRDCRLGSARPPRFARRERATVVDRDEDTIPLPESVAVFANTPPGDAAKPSTLNVPAETVVAPVYVLTPDSVACGPRSWSARRSGERSAERCILPLVSKMPPPEFSVTAQVELNRQVLQGAAGRRRGCPSSCQVVVRRYPKVAGVDRGAPEIAVGARERERAGADLGQPADAGELPPSVALLPLVSKMLPPASASPRG